MRASMYFPVCSYVCADYMHHRINPKSVAHGILDDETYDWVELALGMESTGGEALVVDDDTIVKAHSYAQDKLQVKTHMQTCVHAHASFVILQTTLLS